MGMALERRREVHCVEGVCAEVDGAARGRMGGRHCHHGGTFLVRLNYSLLLQYLTLVYSSDDMWDLNKDDAVTWQSLLEHTIAKGHDCGHDFRPFSHPSPLPFLRPIKHRPRQQHLACSFSSSL